MSAQPPSQYGRGRRARALVMITLLFCAGAYVVAVGGIGAEGSDGTSVVAPASPSPAPAPTSAPLDLEGVPGRAVANPDGSVTVTLSERETGDLVAEALAQAPAQQLSDVAVELRAPPADADGQIVVDGRLDDPPLPVRAVVDLDVVQAQVRPTVRDLRVGPLPLTGAIRDDLNRQLVELALVGEGRLTIDALATDGDRLVVTGRPR